MSTLNFGLVGYGAWGTCHARAIRETPGCELRAVCVSSPEARTRAASETGATVYADFREMAAQPGIDIVDIVVPNYLHEAVACAALESGKHVLLEKPMATTVESCDRIIQAAERSRRLLLVGHEMRFSAMYLQMRELIRSGRLGDPRYILIDLWRRPYRPGSGGWRHDPKRVGNWTLEEPVHFFDAATWFLDGLGNPSTVYARGNSMEASNGLKAGASDNLIAIVGYRNGAYAVISHSLAAVEHHLSIKIFGSHGLVRAEWHAELDRSEHPAYSLEVSDNGAMKKVDVAGTPGELFELREEIAALARAVREGTPLPITPAEGRRAVMLCEAAERSLETGQIITLGNASTAVLTTPPTAPLLG
ncbi:MAG: Gfo/Idh/MocA family protein [Terriglobia bacterium]